MEEKKEAFGKDIFSDSSTYLKFIMKYKNCFSKRKYFTVNEDFEIIKKEPSFILELAYIYYKRADDEIEGIIKNEFLETYREKDRRIARMSKVEGDRLEDGFRRALINKNESHALKLGNELLHRNVHSFFRIMYNLSFLSADSGKLIKTFFTEEIIEDFFQENGTVQHRYSEYTDEIVKNLIYYFVKSDYEFIDFNNSSSIEYFKENRADLLYMMIYLEKYDRIMKKYNLKNIKKIKFEINVNDGYNKLSESRKKLFNYIKESKF